jgi:histidinol phosphatase-like enzyme
MKKVLFIDRDGTLGTGARRIINWMHWINLNFIQVSFSIWDALPKN